MKLITPKELNELELTGNPPFIVDVREPDELEIAQIRHDLNIPLGETPSRFSEIPRDRAVVIMCRSGGRSGKCCEFLESQGYDNVSNLEGGILRWRTDIDPSMKAY